MAKQDAPQPKENEFVDGGLDDFLAADINTEDRAFGSQFALLQWINGTPQGKAAGGDSIMHTGGWFMSANQNIEPPPGFEPFTLMTADGEEVIGFAKKDLTFSPIRQRRCWLSDPGENRLMQRFAQADYESAAEFGKVRGVTHIVAGIEGVDEPVLLSFRGLTSRAVLGQGRDRGIIPRFSQTVCGAAKRIARVLWNDPATGVMRHADAGYGIALDCAREQGLDLPGIL